MLSKIKNIFTVLLITGVLFSCSKEKPVTGNSSLVVEGWIENGDYPVVLVSESFMVQDGKTIHAADIVEHIAKWAKVSVSDGDKTVVLTGMADSRYFPPYIFTTTDIIGQVGKSYSLKVEYKDYVATAETSIPQPVPIDTVYVKEYKDSLASVSCCFTDPVPLGNYYKVFTRTVGVDSHYHPSSIAEAPDYNMRGQAEMILFSTQRLMDHINLPNIYVGDQMWIKLCTMSEDMFRYWTEFESTILSNIGNLTAKRTETSGVSNIHGALGYWAGYGVASEVLFTIDPPATK